jgi:lipid-binding SYLF domain-containing protein
MVIAVVLSMILGLSMQASMAIAGESAEAAQIDREVDAALKKFLEDTPEADIFRKEVIGILVFPNIVKGGFMFGAQYGKGALRKEGKTVGYYSTTVRSLRPTVSRPACRRSGMPCSS